jgi:hypothetical protein
VAESKIGFVLFLSGLTALVLQTPAGQLVDEIHCKTRVVIVGNVATALGCLLLSNYTHIALVTLAVTVNVVSDVFVFPALYATTLGVFGSEGIEQQATLNETGTHSGNATFAILAGVIVVFGAAAPSSIFYICVAMRCVGLFVILRYVNSYDIDFKRSRGLVGVLETSSGDPDLEDSSSHSAASKSTLASIMLMPVEEPLSYGALLSDLHVAVFLACVMLFHFANAAMLPLLSQQLFLNNSNETGG